jgi:hypothetical protein
MSGRFALESYRYQFATDHQPNYLQIQAFMSSQYVALALKIAN